MRCGASPRNSETVWAWSSIFDGGGFPPVAARIHRQTVAWRGRSVEERGTGGDWVECEPVGVDRALIGCLEEVNREESERCAPLWPWSSVWSVGPEDPIKERKYGCCSLALLGGLYPFI